MALARTVDETYVYLRTQVIPNTIEQLYAIADDYRNGKIDANALITQMKVKTEPIMAIARQISPDMETYFRIRFSTMETPLDVINFLKSVEFTDLKDVAEVVIPQLRKKNLDLDDYEKKINSYIKQSRTISTSFHPKLQAVVEDLRKKQQAAYKQLKEVAFEVSGAESRVTKCYKLSHQFFTMGDEVTALPLLVNRTANTNWSAEQTTYFAMFGFPRAFYLALPSIMSGLSYDILFCRGSFTGELSNPTSFTLKQMYMHIRRLNGRQYNFKYKAWWGPMNKIVNDVVENYIGTDFPALILRVGGLSPTVANEIENKGFATLYDLKTKIRYKKYIDELVKVRTLNFRYKRTVQRFAKARLAKFLNTDKKIVQEVSDFYTMPK